MVLIYSLYVIILPLNYGTKKSKNEAFLLINIIYMNFHAIIIEKTAQIYHANMLQVRVCVGGRVLWGSEVFSLSNALLFCIKRKRRQKKKTNGV